MLHQSRARFVPDERGNARFAALIVIAVIVSTEAGARLYEHWHPSVPIDFDGGFSETSRLFVRDHADPAYAITNPIKTVSFPLQRFLLRKPAGTCRVAVLGESSVNYLAPELETLRVRLRDAAVNRCTDIEILNAGGLSYGSQRLALVARELVGYDLDVVVAYLGHNEFEEVEQLDVIRPERAPLYRAATRSAVVRTLLSVLLSMKVARLEEEHRARLLSRNPDVARAWKHPFTMTDVTERMVAFERNLNSIADDCAQAGDSLLMATIPSNVVHPYLPAEAAARYAAVRGLMTKGDFSAAYSQGRKILAETAGRHQSSDLENGVIRKVAAARGLTLVDVDAAVERAEPHHVPGETLFQDHCHLNAAGRAVWIETFAAVLARTLRDLPR